YLAASLRWLRLRLRQLVLVEPGPNVKAKAPAAPARQRGAPEKRPGQTSSVSPSRSAAPRRPPRALVSRGRAVPPAAGIGTSALDAEVADAASQREAAAEIDPPPALLLLAERLGLSTFERDTLLLCVAAELDPSIEALFAAVQGGPARVFPTFSL